MGADDRRLSHPLCPQLKIQANNALPSCQDRSRFVSKQEDTLTRHRLGAGPGIDNGAPFPGCVSFGGILPAPKINDHLIVQLDSNACCNLCELAFAKAADFQAICPFVKART